jgi:hypothetical protein
MQEDSPSNEKPRRLAIHPISAVRGVMINELRVKHNLRQLNVVEHSLYGRIVMA